MESNLVRDKGRKVKLFTSTAFSTHANGADFFVEPMSFNTGAVLSTLDPSLRLVSKERARKGAKIFLNKTQTVEQHYVRTRVATTDAAAFLAELVATSDLVAVKLDIESFEYTLLPHLLLTRPQALCGVQLLAVEWHEDALSELGGMAPQHRGKRDHLSWIMRQPPCNMTLLEWH